MDDTNPEALVTTEWLGEHLGAPGLCVLDGSWHMPSLERDARAEYRAAHIPGALFFDIDDIADETSALPHMVPSAEKFARRVGRLGIGNACRVVVYDSAGVGSAARVWWMFRLFGHRDVAVLDGGLAKWRTEGRPIEAGTVTPQPADYTASVNPALLRRIEDVRTNLDSGVEQVFDARAAGRFSGVGPEPRAGLRGGHIPGSRNLPYLDLYDRDHKTLKPAPALKALFARAGLDPDRPVITSCGSGITACNLALALYRLGRADVAVYDGSWTEWGGRDDTPIET